VFSDSTKYHDVIILLLGIAHRDLKPDNILCVHSDELVPVKLIDFDLASSFMLDGNGSDVVTTPRLRSPVSSHLLMKCSNRYGFLPLPIFNT